jgi:hypothetical protein
LLMNAGAHVRNLHRRDLPHSENSGKVVATRTRHAPSTEDRQSRTSPRQRDLQTNGTSTPPRPYHHHSS